MRIASAVLIGASVMSVAACGGEDTPTAATTPPAATTTSAAAEPAAAAPADKEICEAAAKAGETMKKDLIEAMKNAGADMGAAEYKKVLTGLAEQLNTAAGASDTAVGKAVKDFGAKANEAGAAADPTEAAGNPAFEKAGADLSAACKTVGVTANF